MDNTGNPIPQLSSLTLRLDADNETVACRVRLSLGQISVAINPKSEFLVSWGNATLSIDHAGFDLITQAYIPKHSATIRKRKKPDKQRRSKNQYAAEMEFGLKPAGKATVSREVEVSETLSSPIEVPIVIGRSGPLWEIRSPKKSEGLQGEYIPFDPPICVFDRAPGRNFQEVRGSVHVRQRDMTVKACKTMDKLSRNQEAILNILFAKGVHKVCGDDLQYSGELVLSDIAALSFKQVGK